MFNDFKKFAVKGNVLDIAIGMILGGGVIPLAKALVDDMIMPVVGLAMGRVDFRNLFLVIRQGAEPAPYLTLDAAKTAGAVTINYGVFINTLITFIIVAFAAYLMAGAVQRLRKKDEAKPEPPTPTEKECPRCLFKIPIAAQKCGHCTTDLG